MLIVARLKIEQDLTINEPAIAGGSIKPKVERSGTLGYGGLMIISPRSGRQSVPLKPLSPVSRALEIFASLPRVPLRSTLSFMLPPATAGSLKAFAQIARSVGR
jgi:hypothetical protein